MFLFKNSVLVSFFLFLNNNYDNGIIVNSIFLYAHIIFFKNRNKNDFGILYYRKLIDLTF